MLFDHDSADSLRTRAEVISHKDSPSVKEEIKREEVHATVPITSESAPPSLKAKHHAKIEPAAVPDEFVIPPGKNFGLTIEDVAKFDNDFDNLAKFGGVKGVAKLLKVDPKKGIDGSLPDLVARARDFGENTYPVSEVKPFWSYIVEALQDPTLMILIGCAVVSLAVGLTTEDPKSGWYDGGGVCFAIILVLLVSLGYKRREKSEDCDI